jgi:pimeloyl-ACP methyl ester carboxylesterase
MKHPFKDTNFISYTEYGDHNGYPILIQHGLIASIEDVDLFDRLIQQHARMICIARPGYGESSPYLMESLAEWGDIVASLLDALGIGQFDLLGMSSGAPYSYSIGARLPGSVRNIYIFSGIPALYDEVVRSYWPYPILQNQGMAELEELAHNLFFSNLTEADWNRPDIRDSMKNNCFGVAQDLRLRFVEWGFRLSNIKGKVWIQHSRTDPEIPVGSVIKTAELIPHCRLDLLDNGPHFSTESLDNFLAKTVVENISQYR